MTTPNIYPVLCAPDAETSQKAFHIPFFSDDNASTPFPVITFAYLREGQEESIKEPADLNLSGGELVQSALQNIRSAALEWRSEEIDGQTLLIADGHQLAAEKILDREFIQRASTLLHSPQLFIGIPQRGIILAAAVAQRGALERKMAGLLLDLRKSPLSSLLYCIEDGKITGYHTLSLKGAEAVVETPRSAAPSNVDYLVSNIPLINGRYYLSVVLGAGREGDLLDAIQHFVLDLFLEHLPNRDFMGLLEFQTRAGAPQKTAELNHQLEAFFQRLRQHPFLQKNAQRYGAPLKISFLYGEDFQSGNLHLKRTFDIPN